jgi:hypothetical protein
MNRSRSLVALVALFALALISAPPSHAQEPPEKSAPQKKLTPLKVQVVISEFDGEKKIGSIPYTFYVNASDPPNGQRTSVRLGLRVPIHTGGESSSTQVIYQDVGTNLDCSAHSLPDGAFDLDLSVERSSAYLTNGEDKSHEQQMAGMSVSSTQPVIAQFRTGTHVVIKDGQTVQSNLAADPVDGHVLKVDVTITVVK